MPVRTRHTGIHPCNRRIRQIAEYALGLILIVNNPRNIQNLKRRAVAKRRLLDCFTSCRNIETLQGSAVPECTVSDISNRFRQLHTADCRAVRESTGTDLCDLLAEFDTPQRKTVAHQFIRHNGQFRRQLDLFELRQIHKRTGTDHTD